MISQILKYAGIAVAIPACLYIGLLGLLTTTWFQSHAVYLHAIQMTWFKNLDVPEMFGFLHNQVTPFTISSNNSKEIYAWHILPTGLYRKHEQQLHAEPSGLVPDIESRLALKLLRDDPDARLVIHMHGAGGTVGSGYRVPNYRALSAGDPEKIHVLTFDYRGFGRTPGAPSEHGVLEDAISVVDWALNVANIPASRIVIFGQSLGSAVNTAVAQHYVHQHPPVIFAGHVLVASFVDTPSLVSTYSIAGTIPLLGPMARFPTLFNYLRNFIRDKWSNKDQIQAYVQLNEANKNRYHLTLIHAEDDWDVPSEHTSKLFRHAISATKLEGIGSDDLEKTISESKTDLGASGTIVKWRTDVGVIREEILKFGLHDVIMGNPVITSAVMRIFDGEQ